MVDPFASALDAIFNAPGSEAAEHISTTGKWTRDVRIIRSHRDSETRFSGGGRIEMIREMQIRQSQLEMIDEGDTVLVGKTDESGDFHPSEELVLTGEPLSDVEGLTWTVGYEPVDVSR